MLRFHPWLAWLVLFIFTPGCSGFRTESRTRRVLLETSPPGATVWYQDESGQHSLGRGPVTLEREVEVRVYEFNPWTWVYPVLSAGTVVASGIWYDRASSNDTSSAFALATLISGGIFLLLTLPVAIGQQMLDGEVMHEIPQELMVGAQLDGYTPTRLDLRIPAKRDTISLLLHPVGTTSTGGDLAIVVLRDADIPGVFPSQHLRYTREGLGRIECENRTTLPMELELELSIEGWAEPASTRVALKAGETRWVPVKAAFEEKLLLNPGPRTVQALVEARYVHDDIKRTTRKSYPVELLGGNAFTWAEPARLASFINGRDPVIEELASEVFRLFVYEHPELARRAHPLRNHLLALFTFQALLEAGVRYKPDPDTPFGSLKKGTVDTVLYPSQALQRKVGDCDDLAVLFCSVLEALDVPTAVVPVAGHVFPMYDTGVRQENHAAFPVDASRTVERDGTMWVPLEITLLGKAARFEQAWLAGAEAYHGKYAAPHAAVVVTRQAWVENPPAVLPAGGTKPPRVKLSRAVEQSKALIASHRAQLGALAGRGRSYHALIERGKVLARGGQFDQAAEAFEAAAAKRDTYRARYGIAACHAGQGRMLEALVAFQEALAKAPDKRARFDCQLAIAQCYKTDGNLVKARQHLDQALAVNPAMRFDARYRALFAYVRMKDATKASGQDQTPVYFQEILSGLRLNRPGP